MANVNRQDKAPAAPKVEADDTRDLDFGAWDEEPTGFPPYWTPVEGRKILARPIAKDENDPDFPRYVLVAGAPVPCEQGSADEKKPVTVKKGELFTCSVYGGLPLDRYMGVEVGIVCRGKKAIPGGKSLWVFQLFVSPDQKKVLEAKRAEAKILPPATRVRTADHTQQDGDIPF